MSIPTYKSTLVIFYLKSLSKVGDGRISEEHTGNENKLLRK